MMSPVMRIDEGSMCVNMHNSSTLLKADAGGAKVVRYAEWHFGALWYLYTSNRDAVKGGDG